MSKAARISSSISEPRIYTEHSAIPAKRSDMSEFIGVALFSGIGLFVSRWLAQLAHGSLTLTDNIGGAEFTLELPSD